MSFVLCDITDLAGCRAVVSVQIAVWGQDSEVVPASVLLVSAKRGGILIGAFEEDALIGFVWSMPGRRDGRPTQWSHMLAVSPAARGQRVGELLKLAQRDRALSQDIDLVEWTFDPLQAQNAHLNFSLLGCVASEYRINAYGEMSGPLHRGTPTDRLIAEWWIRAPHVERRLARRSETAGRASPTVRRADILSAPHALSMGQAGEWVECSGIDTSLDAPRVFVAVPPRFGDMQQQAPAAALQWRVAIREAFTAYLARGYRAVDFFLNRAQGSGEYLLAQTSNFKLRTSNFEL